MARLSIWDSAKQENGAPSASDLAFVDPMQRRRLSELGKMALKVAHDCARDLPSVRFVYASRHGELTRTTVMLDGLASGEGISPTAFSLSLINASPGLFSILRHDAAPSISISSGAESFGYGLMEASIQLAAEPREPVLFVYADEPAPDIYGQMTPADGAAHAIGILLDGNATAAVACSSDFIDYQTASAEPQSRAFLRCLEGATTSTWCSDSKTWRWSRQEQ